MSDQRSLLFAAELGVLLSREMFVRAQKLKKKSVRNKLSTHPLPPLCYCGDLLFFSQTFIPHLFPDVTFFCLLLSPQPISPCVLSFFKWRLPAFSAGIFLSTAVRAFKLANSHAALLSQYNEIASAQIERSHFLQLSTYYRGGTDLFWRL